MAGLMHLPPLPTIREIIRIYKLGSIKRLSQNFLLDLNVTNKIVKSMGRNLTGAHVCEVGPGPGSITRPLLEAGVEHLSIVELDKRFIPSLQLLSKASGSRMSIYHGDVLRFNFDQIFPDTLARPWEERPPNIHIVGNLPFGISTPLIIRWMNAIADRNQAWRYGRTRLTLTFQKEIAERMIAQPDDEQRSRLSIMTQYLCDVNLKFIINGRSFVPPPEVDAAVVHFTPKVEPLIPYPFKVVEKVVRHVFQFRQKMCKRGIQTLFPPEQVSMPKEMIEMAEINPEARPFQLTIDEFGRLCGAYMEICRKNPGVIDYYFRDEENAPTWKYNRPTSI